MQVVVNGGLSHYEILNPEAKITMVVLPGWGQSSIHWTPFLGTLPKNIRYVALDLPGFGQTAYLPTGANVKEYSDWLKDLLEKIDVQKPILFGHSFGGQVAAYFAASSPNSLSELILLSPGALREKSKKVERLGKIFQSIHWIKKLLPGIINEKLHQMLASDDYQVATPEQKMVLNNIVRFDLSGYLPKITVPTKIIWGDLDVEIPYTGKRLAMEIPNSELFVLYGSDHSPQITNPRKLTPTMTDILENYDH